MHYTTSNHEWTNPWDEIVPASGMETRPGDLIGNNIFDRAAWLEQEYGITVTNEYTEIYVPVHTFGSITVTKEATGATTPADTTFQLQKKEGDEWINVGEAIAFSKFANNAYNFTDLEEGTYRVIESGATIDGYTLETLLQWMKTDIIQLWVVLRT